MYIFRWLMKHPVIILALYFLSIIAILYSMQTGDSAGHDTDNPATAQTVSSAEVDLTQAPPIEPSKLTTELQTGSESATKVEESIEGNKEELKLDAQAVENVEPTAIAETQEVPADKAPADKVTPSNEFSEMNAEEMLLMAREAYWNNGLDESAQIYQKLIELNPDVVDYRGELGNVYWRQGFPKKAAELYASISLPMIEAGNADRVANMVGFIGLFYPEKATEIHNRLQAEKKQ